MNEKEKKDREIVERIIERNGNCDFIMYCRDCPLNECQDYCGEGENTKLAEQWLSDHPEKTPTEEKINNLETIVCTLDEKYNRVCSQIDGIIEELTVIKDIETMKNIHDIIKCGYCGTDNPLENTICSFCGKPVIRIDDTETVQNIDPITNEGEPEVIGDYMHYQGEDYYKMPEIEPVNVTDTWAYYDNYYWKNIKYIEITDEIAKRRPWVIGEAHAPSKLLYFENGHTVILKGNQEEMYNNVMCMYHHDNVTIATTADLKKAGIKG